MISLSQQNEPCYVMQEKKWIPSGEQFQWSRVKSERCDTERSGSRGLYLYLCFDFLDQYEPDLTWEVRAAYDDIKSAIYSVFKNTNPHVCVMICSHILTTAYLVYTTVL